MMKLMLIKMITMYSLIYNVDPKVSLSVVDVESKFNPNIVSETQDIGLFQLHKSSFPEYSIKQLQDPILNIQLGVQYLAKMKKECKYKDNITYLVCYNYGINNAKKIKHPSLFPYVKKVQLTMNEMSF